MSLYDDLLMTADPSESDTPKLKNPRLIKEMDMDISDLLLHLFKDQPKVINAGYYQYSDYRDGRRNYERDEQGFRGMYTIHFRSKAIAYVTRKPHKQVRLIALDKSSRSHFAQQIMVRVLHDLFPEAKIERIK